MSKPRLLIIDENTQDIHVLLKVLREHYSLVAATRPEAGLQLAQQSPAPDLILLDVTMKGLDGFQILQRLRGDVRTAKIPVIFTSAHLEEEYELKGLALGAVDYLTKPFRIGALKARLSNHLELKFHRDQVQQVMESQVKGLIDSHIMTIFALSKLAESRDDDTGEHLERTRNYCRSLASHLYQQGIYPGQIDPDFIERIYQASPLHDIGKVAIPEHILKKPSKLTDIEFQVMTTHTLRGAATLQEIAQHYPGNEFLRLGCEIARSHHERWDGTGYPDRLKGENIPLAARIMALADVYDALTTRRSYKPAYSHERACQIIEAQKNLHFDPRIVEAFLSIESHFKDLASLKQKE